MARQNHPESAPQRPSKVRWVVLAFALLVLLAAGVAGLMIIPRLMDPTRLVAADWYEYRSKFITPDGRVVDTGNSDVSHSESQGYGMLFAEAFGDRKTFDRLWQWTRDNLQTRQDALLSWRWRPAGPDGQPAGVDDPNNASDGELLVAWALWRASVRWEDEMYAKASLKILADFHRICCKETEAGYVMLPGEFGFVEDGRIILNPSYYIFPAFQELSLFTLKTQLRNLAASGLDLITRARFGAYELVPDWVVFANGEFELPTNHLPSEFGYNAIRVPLHLAWAQPTAEALKPFVAYWKAQEGKDLPATVLLPSDERGPDPALPGMCAVASFVTTVFERKPFYPKDVPRLEDGESYYSASLKLLTQLAARDVARMQLGN